MVLLVCWVVLEWRFSLDAKLNLSILWSYNNSTWKTGSLDLVLSLKLFSKSHFNFYSPLILAAIWHWKIDWPVTVRLILAVASPWPLATMISTGPVQSLWQSDKVSKLCPVIVSTLHWGRSFKTEPSASLKVTLGVGSPLKGTVILRVWPTFTDWSLKRSVFITGTTENKSSKYILCTQIMHMHHAFNNPYGSKLKRRKQSFICVTEMRKATTCHKRQFAISDKSPLEWKGDNLPQIDWGDRSPQKGGTTTCHNKWTD